MLDVIRRVFTHPAFQKGRVGNGWKDNRPFASERFIREYAADGIAYRERRVTFYDFAVHGGAVGEIILDGPVYDNETIVDGLIVGHTVPASGGGGGGTIAIGTSAGSAANSLKTAAAEDSYTADGTLPMIPLGHGTGEVKLSADGFISITVATDALTAGKFFIFYDVVYTGA